MNSLQVAFLKNKDFQERKKKKSTKKDSKSDKISTCLK